MRRFGLFSDVDPFDGLFRLQPRAAGPPVNVYVKPDGWVVRVEVPGVAQESLSIEAEGRDLRISGKREPLAAADGSFLRRERWSGEFARSIQLPADLDGSRAEAGYRHGVLTVRIPRKEAALARQIPIEADAGETRVAVEEGGKQ